MQITELEIAARLLLAAILGGLIGLERESHRRPAGFRTHILVCLGSSLVMLVGVYAFASPWGSPQLSYDPGRLAAQVVSGIGFLGAGTILREGPTIRGLTTAASLWVVAGIGLAVGAGFYFGATLTTALAVSTLILLSRVERRVLSSKDVTLAVTISDQPGRLAAIASVLARHKVNIRSVEISEEPGMKAALGLTVEVPPQVDRALLLAEVTALEGIYRAAYEE